MNPCVLIHMPYGDGRLVVAVIEVNTMSWAGFRARGSEDRVALSNQLDTAANTVRRAMETVPLTAEPAADLSRFGTTLNLMNLPIEATPPLNYSDEVHSLLGKPLPADLDRLLFGQPATSRPVGQLRLGFVNPDTSTYPGEGRVFLPHTVAEMAHWVNGRVLLQQGYGSGMMPYAPKYPFDPRDAPVYDEQPTAESVAAKCDMLFSLKWPGDHVVGAMRRGAILFTMAHYPSHETRRTFLADRGIATLSLDGVVGGDGLRLVENMWLLANIDSSCCTATCSINLT